MKKVIKISACIVVLFIICIAAYGFNVFNEMKKMKSIETGAVTDDVFAVNNGFANLYLIKGENGYIAVDAGANISATASEMERLKISPDDVKAVFLTHSDRDHTASLSLFKNAKIYLPKDEVQMIDGTTKRNFLARRNKFDYDYEAISDEQSIDLYGMTVSCISSPGHTPGSVSYLINDKYMFVGDNLSLNEGKVELFNSFYNMDDEVQLTTLSKLAKIPAEYIFTAHYGYTDNAELAFVSVD